MYKFWKGCQDAEAGNSADAYPAILLHCWPPFDKTNPRNPILEHTHVEAPKEFKYQLGQLDTILLWPELKRNKTQAAWLESQQKRPWATGVLIQNLHHPPLNWMKLMKSVLFQATALHGLLGLLCQQVWRHSKAGLTAREEYERESAHS